LCTSKNGFREVTSQLVDNGALLGMALAATEAWAGNVKILYLVCAASKLNQPLGLECKPLLNAGVDRLLDFRVTLANFERQLGM
jgi:hypothetical protein